MSQKVPANVFINSGTSSIRIGYDGRTNEYNINIDTTAPMIDKIEPTSNKTVEHYRPPDIDLGDCPTPLTLQGEHSSHLLRRFLDRCETRPSQKE